MEESARRDARDGLGHDVFGSDEVEDVSELDAAVAAVTVGWVGCLDYKGALGGGAGTLND